MSLAKPLTTIFQYIEQNQESFLNRLKNAIAIQSIPTTENYSSIHDMINWISDLLNSFEVQTELRNIQDESYRGITPLPPVLLGNLEKGFCPNKATVLVYGHLDVKDAQKRDGWKNEPFDLYKEEGFLYGRGVLDKCSLVAWLNAVEAYHSLGIDFPVNIKFIFESLGTQSSPGLKNLLLSEKDKFLAHVDYICISKGSWLQSEIPCLMKSLKGICCFLVEVESAPKNLDSDICGGMVQEAMSDLLFVLRSLTDEKGNLDISSIQLEIEPISDEDLQIYRKANFNLNSFLNSIGAHCPSHIGDKFEILKHRLSLPTITIHDIKSPCIESTYSQIPGSVTAKISIRTVHSQKADTVFETIKRYLQNVWSQNGSNNKMSITLEKSLDGWLADVTHDHFQVGVKAFKYVYELDPCFLSNGCIIPAVNMLTEVFKRNVIVLPIGSAENYDINENFECSNYYNAAKVLAAYLYEMGELPRLLNRSSTSFASCTSCPSTAETCVCGRFREKIQAASGDAEKCVCTDLLCQSKPIEDPIKNVEDEHKTDVLLQTTNEEDAIVQPIEIPEEIENVKDELESDVPSQTKNEEDEIISAIEIPEEIEPVELPPPLLRTICECPLISVQISPKPPVGEIISLISTTSKLSHDPTPILEPGLPKKDITPSVDTLKCICTPKLYRNVTRQKSVTTERQNELMKNMRSVGSELSGISAGESQPNMKTTKTNTMVCVCPEKSADTVFEESRQIERMLCPIKNTKKEETCTKGGKRKHHIIGPVPIDEEDSEISLGPVSHCSCSSEELIVVQCCDCDTKSGSPHVAKENKNPLPENLEDEVD